MINRQWYGRNKVFDKTSKTTNRDVIVMHVRNAINQQCRCCWCGKRKFGLVNLLNDPIQLFILERVRLSYGGTSKEPKRVSLLCSVSLFGLFGRHPPPISAWDCKPWSNKVGMGGLGEFVHCESQPGRAAKLVELLSWDFWLYYQGKFQSRVPR